MEGYTSKNISKEGIKEERKSHQICASQDEEIPEVQHRLSYCRTSENDSIIKQNIKKELAINLCSNKEEDEKITCQKGSKWNEKSINNHEKEYGRFDQYEENQEIKDIVSCNITSVSSGANAKDNNGDKITENAFRQNEKSLIFNKLEGEISHNLRIQEEDIYIKIKHGDGKIAEDNHISKEDPILGSNNNKTFKPENKISHNGQFSDQNNKSNKRDVQIDQNSIIRNEDSIVNDKKKQTQKIQVTIENERISKQYDIRQDGDLSQGYDMIKAGEYCQNSLRVNNYNEKQESVSGSLINIRPQKKDNNNVNIESKTINMDFFQIEDRKSHEEISIEIQSKDCVVEKIIDDNVEEEMETSCTTNGKIEKRSFNLTNSNEVEPLPSTDVILSHDDSLSETALPENQWYSKEEIFSPKEPFNYQSKVLYEENNQHVPIPKVKDFKHHNKALLHSIESKRASFPSTSKGQRLYVQTYRNYEYSTFGRTKSAPEGEGRCNAANGTTNKEVVDGEVSNVKQEKHDEKYQEVEKKSSSKPAFPNLASISNNNDGDLFHCGKQVFNKNNETSGIMFHCGSNTISANASQTLNSPQFRRRMPSLGTIAMLAYYTEDHFKQFERENLNERRDLKRDFKAKIAEAKKTLREARKKAQEQTVARRFDEAVKKHREMQQLRRVSIRNTSSKSTTPTVKQDPKKRLTNAISDVIVKKKELEIREIHKAEAQLGRATVAKKTKERLTRTAHVDLVSRPTSIKTRMRRDRERMERYEVEYLISELKYLNMDEYAVKLVEAQQCKEELENSLRTRLAEKRKLAADMTRKRKLEEQARVREEERIRKVLEKERQERERIEREAIERELQRKEAIKRREKNLKLWELYNFTVLTTDKSRSFTYSYLPALKTQAPEKEEKPKKIKLKNIQSRYRFR